MQALDKLLFIVLVLTPGMALATLFAHYVVKPRIRLALLQSQFAFKLAWWNQLSGAYCISVETPDWGGMARVKPSLRHFSTRILFIGATKRPMPRLRCEKSGAAISTTSEVSGIEAAFAEHVAPHLATFDEHSPRVTLSLGGHRVEVEIATRRSDAEGNLALLLGFIEKLLNWSQELPFEADPNACRYCGGPNAEADCERCRAPYHRACFQKLGTCHVWGCRSKIGLLYTLEERAH